MEGGRDGSQEIKDCESGDSRSDGRIDHGCGLIRMNKVPFGIAMYASMPYPGAAEPTIPDS